jgi:hypothetical protein
MSSRSSEPFGLSTGSEQCVRYSCAKKLEVVQPYNPQVIHFDTPDDFNAYYNKHQDDFNDISTYKLNVKYKIPGFKLSKLQGQLKLVKDYAHKPTTTTQQASLEANSHTLLTAKEIQKISTSITALEQRISSIEAYLQSLSP